MNASAILYANNIVRFSAEVLNIHPDPVQTTLLQSKDRRGIICCTRQWGKSTAGAIKALHMAYFNPRSLILVASPGNRQSGELVMKCADFLPTLDIEHRSDGRNRGSILLPNSSRIIPLPGVARKIRGFSAPSLILVDEAAYVGDDIYLALLPMLATTNGGLWMMSTPNGRQGFFYQEWTNRDNGFTRISVTARECPRISQAFLEDEYRRVPSHFFEQEYLCSFNGDGDSLFSMEDLEAALDPSVTPFFTTGPYR